MLWNHIYYNIIIIFIFIKVINIIKKQINKNIFVLYLYDIHKYFIKITNIITNILFRSQKEELTFDISDKEKQRQMKIGEIMQAVLGNYNNFMDLGKGHESRLDIMSVNKKIIIGLIALLNHSNLL